MIMIMIMIIIIIIIIIIIHIVQRSSRARLAQYICDVIHPTDLMIPNSRILFM